MLIPRMISLVFALYSLTCSSQVLIKNAHVVDVIGKKILTGYDVVAVEGKIISVDKGKKYKLPAGTEVIDASGKYLVPGFADAHIHFFQSGGIFTRPDVIDLRKYRSHNEELKWVHDHMEDFLRRYAASGITSVIDVGANNNFLLQKDSFKYKEYSPIIKMTGPLLTTWVPDQYKGLGNDGPFIEMTSEAVARQAVRDQIGYKSDFIKIWYIVSDSNVERGASKSLPLVKAAIDEAHKNQLRIAVHATEMVTARLAVEAGADFLVHGIDDQVVNNEFLGLLKKKNVVLCPTLVVHENYGSSLGGTYRFSTEELALAHPLQVGTILDYPLTDTSLSNKYRKYFSSRNFQVIKARKDSIMKANLLKMIKAGITIATGTDAGNIGTQHVGSYFTELTAMQDAGMDNWALLQASTINPAKAIGNEKEWGSITKDKWANMVLLNANPVENINNWKNIDLIFLKGKPWKAADLVKITPEMLVQQQLNAYNAHDLEAFLLPYADTVQVFRFPGTIEMNGKDEMRKAYQFIKETPKLYCKLLNRIVQGNMVIDHEEVWGFGEKPFYGIAIYVIENGKISKVYFPEAKGE